MNSKHMVAESEVNKRQDFIKYVQGLELINTEFEHGTWLRESQKSCGLAERVTEIRNRPETYQ